MTFAETLDWVIALADKVWEYWDAELPKRHPEYPIVREGEDSGPPPPEQAELRALLGSLGLPDLHRLIALMYFGRRFSPADFAAEYRQAADHFPDPAVAVEYLAEFPPLADQLRDGRDKLAAAGQSSEVAGPAAVA